MQGLSAVIMVLRPNLAVIKSCRRLKKLFLLSTAFWASTFLSAAAQEVHPPTFTSLGTVGLLDMPSAFTAPDGAFAFGASYMKGTQHYNLSFQALPWLETSFRYSGLSHFDAGYPVYWDRSFGAKARIFDEGILRPAISVGIDDIIGTGIYSGEYVVASKHIGSVELTAGMGWGRFGTANQIKNPIGSLVPSFKKDVALGTDPGNVSARSLFHGKDAGFFAGVAWATPIEGLSLIGELSSDGYQRQKQTQNFHPKSQLNLGLSYHVSDATQLHLGYLYGTTISGGLTFTADPTKSPYPTRLGEAPPTPLIRPPEEQEAALNKIAGRESELGDKALKINTSWQSRFVDRLLENPAIEDVSFSGRRLNIVISNPKPSHAFCSDIASLAQAHGLDLREVWVRDKKNKPSQNCSVQNYTLVNEPSFSFGGIGATSLQNAQSPVLIDASILLPNIDYKSAEKQFKTDAKKQGVIIDALQFSPSVATVYFTNNLYRTESEALDRLVRLLMNDTPPSIEKFRLISTSSDIAQQEFVFLRSPLERILGEQDKEASVFDSPVMIKNAPPNNPILISQLKKQEPQFGWNIYPHLRQQLFDPNNPVGVQVLGALEAGLSLAPGLSIWGQGEASIFDTYRTDRPSDSVLPHVRTDFVKYFIQGKYGIGALQANYRTKLTPQIYATIKAGYLESMFAGLGGEVLYRPDGARWAIGADLYEVKQRNYDRLLGLMPYRATTGHVTLYWDAPFWDLNFQLRAGQYLAKDRGVTFQVTRRFSTGFEIGVFFSKTNVSKEQFGEGSFDKGIILRIPLDWVTPFNTQSEFSTMLRPTQRDGGQVLLGDATLYEETRRSSQSDFASSGITFAEN